MTASPMFEPFRERGPRRADRPADLHIRPATLADCETLAKISVARNGGRLEAEAERFGRQIRKGEDSHDLLVLLAEAETRVVAFARVGRHRWLSPEDQGVPEGWYLLGVVVAREVRRRGIGRSLTASRLEWLEPHASEAFYFADSGNLVSIAMHAEFGFTEIARDIHYPGVSFSSGQGVLLRAPLPFRP